MRVCMFVCVRVCVCACCYEYTHIRAGYTTCMEHNLDVSVGQGGGGSWNVF